MDVFVCLFLSQKLRFEVKKTTNWILFLTNTDFGFTKH